MAVKKLRFLRSLTILILCIISFSCSHKQGNTSGTFFYNEPDGLSTLDPALMGYRAAIWAGNQLYNGLVQLDSSLQAVPAIARSWSVDTTGTEWTFILRNDVYYHQNQCFGENKTRTVKADDVKYSFERICDARTRSTGLWIFRDRLVGAKEFFTATNAGTPANGIRGITVVNDSTIRFRLTAPFAPFLSLLSMPYCFIIPKEAVEFYGRDFFKHPVGTGPFSFVEWKPDISLALQRNPKYFEKDAHGNSLPYLERISITFLRDTKSEFLEFKQGKLDFVSSIDPSFAPSVLTPEGHLTPEYSGYQLLQTAAYSVEYYGILLDSNSEITKNIPLARSKKLRQALNYAIDREKIVRYVLNGKGIAAEYGVLPPGMPGFSKETTGYRYNPDKAKALMAEAGFPDGKGLPPLTLQMGQNERTASVAEAIQQQWKEIGIHLSIKQVDFPQHLQMVRSGKLPLWRTSWIGDYPDPENFIALFYSPFTAPQGPNTTHIARRDLDSLYDAALSPLLTQAQRYQIYNRMESIILDEAPWIFLYYNIIQRLVQPNVQGLGIDGADRLVLARVRKNK